MIFSGYISNFIFKCNWYILYLRFSLFVVNYAIHFSIFSRWIGVLFEEATNTSGALVATAAWCDVSLHFLLVVFYSSCLANHYLSFAFNNAQSSVETTNKCLHFIFDATLTLIIAGFILTKTNYTIKEAG